MRFLGKFVGLVVLAFALTGPVAAGPEDLSSQSPLTSPLHSWYPGNVYNRMQPSEPRWQVGQDAPQPGEAPSPGVQAVIILPLIALMVVLVLITGS